jgi:hypothetical protein
MANYFEDWLDLIGFGRKDASLRDKIKHHQDRHVELMFSYQELWQDAFNAMLDSSLKGDMNAVQKTHKEFLDGLNKTLEAMFNNHIELASHAPEKMGQLLNLHRDNYENIFDKFPKIREIKSQTKRNDAMNSMKKLALGAMSAALATVAVPTKGLTSLHEIDTGKRSTVSAPVAVAPMVYRSYIQNPIVGRTHVLCPGNFAEDRTAPSRVYEGLNYPKGVMIHPYNPVDGERINAGLISVPLSMFLPTEYRDNLPDSIKRMLLTGNINPQRTQIMVIAQNFPWIDGTQLSYRPQYGSDPNAPAKAPKGRPVNSARNIVAGIVNSTNNEVTLSDLVVRPGGNPNNGADYVEVPKLINSFNPFTVSTHSDANIDESDVVLSGIAPHVKGLTSRGQSFWSFFGYKADDGQNSAFATLHLVLNDDQLEVMQRILQAQLPRHGNPLNHMLNVVNALQETPEFNDGGEHLSKLAALMGFVSPKIAYYIQKTNDTPCELHGLSGPEDTHRWSQTEHVQIDVPLHPGAKTLTFDTLGYVSADHGQTVSVSVNGIPSNGPVLYDLQHRAKVITAILPRNRDHARVEFVIPTKRSPGGGDPRELGIAFKTIEESLPYHLSRQVQHNIGQDVPMPLQLKAGEFAASEGTHRWTVGQLSTMTIPLDADINQRPHAITFMDVSSCIPGHHTQLVNVKLNGVLVGQYIFSAANPTQTIKVPIPANLEGNAQLVFETPNARAPGPQDPRVLGIRLSQAALSYLQ